LTAFLGRKVSLPKEVILVEFLFIFIGVAIYWFIIANLDGVLKRLSDNKVKIALANRDKAQAELELAKLESAKSIQL
jgi:hypothetical protein